MAQNAPASSIQAGGANLVTTGGSFSKLNVTAAVVIKATPGRLCKVIVNGTVGTGATYTFNDCATVGAAAASNQIVVLSGTTAVGSPITLDWPCTVGIVLSVFATGGAPILSVSYS
jgi:hypothetical protein